MKTGNILRISIVWIIIQSLFMPVKIHAVSNPYEVELAKYAKHAKVVSGGFRNGNRVLIQMGSHIFYDNVPHGKETAGLYVVAIFKDRVLLHCFYNTFRTEWDSTSFAWGIESLPKGAFVIIAAKDEATIHFTKRAQQALRQIGAEKGLIGQEYRTSYLCIGVKGLAKGKAIEKIGMQELIYTGVDIDKIDEFNMLLKNNLSISENEKAKVIKKDLPYGSYLQYIPKSFKPRRKTRVAVLVHGMLAKNGGGLRTADTFIKRWIPTAEKKRLILIAPIFDKDFGGKAGPGGGYRGLFGRKIDADDFLNLIVDRYKYFFPSFEGRFYLYGHSAGAQFVSRYVVKHPQRIISAVISAAGHLPFPDPNVPWADGMARLKRKMTWGGPEPVREIDFQPNPQGWLIASQLPITLVVGALDTSEKSHVETARQWYKAMNKLARQHEKSGKVKLRVVPKVGHNSLKLTPFCIKALFRR